jgi:aspartyl-tRNA(Asn)/glutamyl-tRNA(Gln) amidotransferase subunit A
MEGAGRVFPVVAALTRLTRPFSYLGLPVLTVPIGLDRHGMPVGAQLVGRPFGEARLLSLGARLADALGWSFTPGLPARRNEEKLA